MSKEAMKLALGKIKSARDCHPNAVDALLFEAEEILEDVWAEHPKGRPVESDYASQVAYTRALEAYCDGLAEQPAPVHEMTPAMMRKVQMHSELGAYAAENLSGAYELFQEFWRVAMSAAPKPAQQEPVIWAISYDGKTPYAIWPDGDGALLDLEIKRQGGTASKMPLYTSPPAQRTWVGLTDEQVIKTFNAICNGKPFDVKRIFELHRAIEAKLKEKNT